MNQNGGNGPAVHAAAIDAQQQADGGNKVHAEGEGDQQGDAHGGRHARDGAEENAACSTQQRHQQHLGIQKYICVTGEQ